ncbi:hypothetical protein [Micromonospora sp. NBRC 101691]|uniref:hypothetical protein n=1 Tax=Micromonospora sp. NBRC 101691 TaxID=3032198 RepID=UPI0024A5ADC7|nr:hypothetical protein [Micromonospora sp. NBRC 101691]GLY24104.1 hypothetical protein Misp04_38360 [Micromonospora sp. NBRC 101691]
MWWETGTIAAVAWSAAVCLVWTAHHVGRVHLRAASAAHAPDQRLLRRAATAVVVAERSDAIERYAAARLALNAGLGKRAAAENEAA